MRDYFSNDVETAARLAQDERPLPIERAPDPDADAVREAHARTVVCPDCAAPVGAPCLGTDGRAHAMRYPPDTDEVVGRFVRERFAAWRAERGEGDG